MVEPAGEADCGVAGPPAEHCAHLLRDIVNTTDVATSLVTLDQAAKLTDRTITFVDDNTSPIRTGFPHPTEHDHRPDRRPAHREQTG